MENIFNMTILLVNDEDEIIFSQANLLRGYGYTVVTALSGEDAIEILDRGSLPIHTIMMDTDLGAGMDGFDTAREIMKKHDIPIIFLPLSTEDEMLKKIKELTYYGYKKLKILNTLISTINKSHTLNELMQNVLKSSLELLEFDGGGIYLVNEDGQTASVVYSEGLPDIFLNEVKNINIHNKPYDTIFDNKQPVISEHYEKISPDKAEYTGFKSMASLPIISDDRVIGALNVASKKRVIISDFEKSILNTISYELAGSIDKMRMKEKIEANEKNLHSLFNAIQDMLFVLSVEGNIRYVNDGVWQKLGYYKSELYDQPIWSLHPKDQENAIKLELKEMMEGKRDISLIPMVTRNGDLIQTETKAVKGLWSGENVIIGVTRDISEHRIFENNLQKAMAILSSKNKELEEFTYTVSHDLKAPLVNIVILLRYIKENMDKNIDQVRDDIISLERNVKNMENMFNGILKYSRATIKKSVNEVIKTRDLIHEIMYTLNFPDSFSVTIHDNVPETLTGEPIKLQQIFTNIIGNAVKHHERTDGKIEIEYSDIGEFHQFTIADDGPGIDPKYHQKIFQLFQTIKKKNNGVESSGIGLAIVKNIIEARGGNIRLESESGKGARFIFTLPKS